MPARLVFFLRAAILSALVFQAGCGGSSPPVSDPEFLVVVNDNATGAGLVEYALPLVSGQAPVTRLASQGTYLGGVSDGINLFAFGEGAANAPALWRYSLPLSTSPAPATLTGLGGIPVGGTSLAGGSVVVFLEKNTTNQTACLEAYNLTDLLDSSGGNITSSSPCSSNAISPPPGATSFLTGAVQLSSDGSDLFVEEVYQTSGGTETVIESYATSTYSRIARLSPPSSYPSPITALEGGAESGNVVLLLPHPSTPGVDFYLVTALISGSSNIQPINPTYASSIALTTAPTLLALDIFGTYLYTAQSNGSGDSIAAFRLNDVQNGSNASPYAQTGAGLSLTPSGLIVIVSSSG